MQVLTFIIENVSVFLGMRKSTKKQENIRRYILELIIDGKKGIAKKTSEAFGVSEMTVYRYLRSMQEEGILTRNAEGYSLVKEIKCHNIGLGDGEEVEEDEVYRKYLESCVAEMPENVRRIWEYCFMEMMNNAIEHSGADLVTLLIIKDYMNTAVAIIDNGIGIFRKIQDFFAYKSVGEVMEELFKGKLTTDSKNHTGEGIFFTSRIMDYFAAISDNAVFTNDKCTDWKYDLTDHPEIAEKIDMDHGTVIFMRLSNYSKKTTKEIFDEYADIEGGFIRTRIPLKNIYETYPVSRSQAKRLSSRFDSFEEVELDFDGVDEIGQGFAHELFVKYADLHPETRLIPIHTNTTIDRMLHHVNAGQYK